MTDAEKTEKYDQFQTWLAHMDDFLEDLQSHSLVTEAGITLDYSIASLDAVEALILKRFPSFEDVKNPDASQDINLFSIYVGETIRKTGGGKWAIDYEDTDNAYFGRPVLKGVGSRGQRTTCPMMLVTASTDRRKGDYLSKVVRHITG